MTGTRGSLDFTSGMRRYLLRTAVFAFAILVIAGAIMPVAAANSGTGDAMPQFLLSADEEKAAGPETGPLQERALWSVLGIAVGCAIGGAFYMLRRNMGHFANPAWVAPISIMLSKDSPESFGDAPADAHGSHH